MNKKEKHAPSQVLCPTCIDGMIDFDARGTGCCRRCRTTLMLKSNDTKYAGIDAEVVAIMRLEAVKLKGMGPIFEKGAIWMYHRIFMDAMNAIRYAVREDQQRKLQAQLDTKHLEINSRDNTIRQLEQRIQNEKGFAIQVKDALEAVIKGRNEELEAEKGSYKELSADYAHFREEAARQRKKVRIQRWVIGIMVLVYVVLVAYLVILQHSI